MVKEINGYAEEQAKKEAERRKLESWFAIASEVFQKPLYQIVDGRTDFQPNLRVHFVGPNQHSVKSTELLHKTDSSNTALYNSLAERCNIFGGYYPAVDLHPLRDCIDARCPEVYDDARRLAENLEKKLKVEVSLRTMYPQK